jgi:hypothetical protein
MKPSQNDIDAVFEMGLIAHWYLRPSQRDFYEMLKSKKRVVAKCHRRFGKGTTVFVYAFERAVREKIIIRYGAPTQKQAYEIIAILIDHIYEKAPSKKPKLLNGNYVWPNGSTLFVFGCKDSAEADKARGTESHVIICDEFAFWKYRPSYVLKSVLSPQLDTTDGQLVITSTPPDDLTHPYIDEVAVAERDGYLFSWNIMDSIRVSEVSRETYQKIVERCGGEDTDDFKREYMCELVANKSRLVIPEAQREDLYVGAQKRPEYANWIFTCDLGLKDFFHGIWAYTDFKASRLVVEAEFCANYMSTREITEALKEKESGLGTLQNLRRLGDSNDPQQLWDMAKDHDYTVAPILKRSKMNNAGFRESVINGLRIAISQGRLLVDKEKCPHLVAQLKYGIWNEHRSDFERTEKLGHLDGLMALAYMYDNADFHSNPYPLLHPDAKEETHFISPDLAKPKNEMKKLIGLG